MHVSGHQDAGWSDKQISAVDSAQVWAGWPQTGPMNSIQIRSTARSTAQRSLRQPQLTPYALLLQRKSDEIQVGIDPDSALVFRGAGFGAVLDLLDGSRPTSVVRRAGRAAGLTADQVSGALDALAAAGMLAERDSMPYTNALASSTVRLIGAGAVGS